MQPVSGAAVALADVELIVPVAPAGPGLAVGYRGPRPVAGATAPVWEEGEAAPEAQAGVGVEAIARVWVVEWQDHSSRSY